MRDSEAKQKDIDRRKYRHWKQVERANNSQLVNRLVAPHLKELQQKELAPAIPPGELKVLTFLDAGLEVFQWEIQPSVAQAIAEQVTAMKRWTPKLVMNFLLTMQDDPEGSTDLIPRLRKVETPQQATHLLIEVIQNQLESDPDLQLDLSSSPLQKIP